MESHLSFGLHGFINHTINFFADRRLFLLLLGYGLVANSQPVSAADCVPQPAGLISWWRGEANALDQAGSNDGTLAGNTTFSSGRVGQGFEFDGNGAVVQLGNPANLHLQDLTIETWIRRSSTTVASLNGNGNGVIFGFHIGGYGLYMDANGTPTLSKIGIDEVKPGVTITDTDLHHVAVTKVGSTVVFYVDGVAYPAAAYDPGFTFSENAFIGGLDNQYTFYGTVDELSVYSRALAASEIQAVYNASSAGKCVTASPPPVCTTAPQGLISWWRGEANALDQAGSNNGTLAGNTTFSSGRVGQGFEFDGNGAVVQLGNPANLHLQDLTIETWIRRSSTTIASLNGNGNGVIFGFHIGGFGLYMDANGTPTLSKIGIDEVKPGVTITDTDLHHVAVTKVGSTVVFYVDGVAYPAAAYDPGFTFSENAFIGGLDNQYTFYGTVDELSVYSRALAASEIQAVYNASSAGKCQTVTLLKGLVEANIPDHSDRAQLVNWLRQAGDAFDRCHVEQGVKFLEFFKQRVQARIAPTDAELAAALIETANAIIEAAPDC